MKEIISKIKQNIFAFILGGIILGSLSVYAATILASQIEYTNNNQENVQGAIDDLYNKTLYLGKIKIGDYVKMTPTLTSYTILSSDTGYSTNQTIEPNELNIWRIISINSDGTADAVSQYVSSSKVNFNGQIGYQNYVGTLNKIASSYTNSNYVVRTKYMGFGGGTGYIEDTSKLTKNTAPWSKTTNDLTLPNDEKLGGGDMGYEHDYNLLEKVLGTAIANNVKTEKSAYYWIASRNYEYVSSNSWSFRTIEINNKGEVFYYYLLKYENNEFVQYNSSSGIRPIITLKSGLTTSGGDGKSESTAWTFN